MFKKFPTEPFIPASTMSNTTLNLTTNSYNNSTTPDGPRGPPLWYQYPECAVAPYGYVFYFTGKMFNLAVGTPCNVLVIWQIATRRSDVSSDIFFLNLAILDTYFCLMGPVDMANRLVLSSGRLWYFQRFAYGVKDLAPLFLVSYGIKLFIGHFNVSSKNSDSQMIRYWTKSFSPLVCMH